MKKKTKKKVAPRRGPRKMLTDDLCGHLSRIAAFNLDDRPAAQMKVYEAIRRLRLLDAAAIEAGIIPAPRPARSSREGE